MAHRDRLNAALDLEKPSVLSRWWFWTGAVVVVGGGVAVTYFATRSTPQAAPFDGGSTGWVAHPTAHAIHF